MLFKLTNAFATYQKVVNDALKKYLNHFVVTYLNDILIYFKTMKKHVKHVSKILKCLSQRNLRFKLEKCEFHRQKVKYLGFVVEQRELRMNSNKIKTIKE